MKKCFSIEVADNFFCRLKGLMFRKTFPDDAVLEIIPCSSIHTCFMRFPITVIFTDKNNRIVDYRTNIQPWSMFIPKGNARKAWEIRYQGNEQIKIDIGDILDYQNKNIFLPVTE